MKRALCIFLALFAAAALFACSQKQDTDNSGLVTHAYDPAVDGEAEELIAIFYGEGEDSAGHDLSIWSRALTEFHKDDSAPQTASIELMGKTFEGNYSYSAVYYPAAHLSHYYKGDFGGFSVNAETGAIDSFNASYEETEKTLSAEACRARADAVAAQFIDLGEYIAETTESENRYFFTYTKYVEGLPTNDKLGVGISVFGGGITTLGTSLVGSFEVNEETERVVRRLKNADLGSAVKAKIDGRFSGEFEMSMDDFSVICMPDGVIAMMTTVEVRQMVKDVADGESYYYPATSAFDTFIFERVEKGE